MTLGWPTSIYQLPQVTENELSSELVASLASSFPNFLCFKDSSGTDRVALSGLDFAGLKLLRGAEVGGYATWLKNVGGPYDAFLLSTANVFARQFCEMISLLDGGDAQLAHVLASELENVVSSMFATVAGYPFGNAFCNVNKALDHCFAYGREAIHSPLPMLHGGERLPMEFIVAALRLLRQHEWFNEIGYLA